MTTPPDDTEGLRERLIARLDSEPLFGAAETVDAFLAVVSPVLERLRAERDEWKQVAEAEARADEAERAVARGLALCDDYATHHPDWRPLATQTAVVFRRALTGEGDKKWLEGLASVAAERDRLAGEVAELQNERDLLREALGESDLGAQVLAQWEAIAAADADRDRLEAQVAALQRDLAEAKQAYLAVLEGAELRGTIRTLERELTEAKKAVHAAQITHIREWHPNYAHVGACAACQALVAISRALPSRPDDPEEIRRLAGEGQ